MRLRASLHCVLSTLMCFLNERCELSTETWQILVETELQYSSKPGCTFLFDCRFVWPRLASPLSGKIFSCLVLSCLGMDVTLFRQISKYLSKTLLQNHCTLIIVHHDINHNKGNVKYTVYDKRFYRWSRIKGPWCIFNSSHSSLKNMSFSGFVSNERKAITWNNLHHMASICHNDLNDNDKSPW